MGFQQRKNALEKSFNAKWRPIAFSGRESAPEREHVWQSASASATNTLKVSLKSYITMKNASVLSAVAVAVAFAFVGAIALCFRFHWKLSRQLQAVALAFLSCRLATTTITTAATATATATTKAAAFGPKLWLWLRLWLCLWLRGRRWHLSRLRSQLFIVVVAASIIVRYIFWTAQRCPSER